MRGGATLEEQARILRKADQGSSLTDIYAASSLDVVYFESRVEGFCREPHTRWTAGPDYIGNWRVTRARGRR